MRRGDVFDANLDPAQGSEQAGMRPVIIVSRDSINSHRSVVVVVPCTTYRGHRSFPSQTIIHAPEGGLTADSVALGEQVRAVAKTRLVRQRGSLSPEVLATVDKMLLIALDLPGQP